MDYVNRKYAEIWPNINKMGEPPADREDWKGVEEKFKPL